MRQAHFVPSTKKVDEMVEFFQENRTRLALVIGEYANVLGIVSIRDVAAFMLGKLAPPSQEPGVREIELSKVYTIPGDMSLVDFNQLVGADLDDPSMNTVGGLMMRLLNRLPRVGDSVTFEGFIFAVEQMQRLRIDRFRVTRLDLGPDPEPEPEVPPTPTPPAQDLEGIPAGAESPAQEAAAMADTASALAAVPPASAGDETADLDASSANNPSAKKGV